LDKPVAGQRQPNSAPTRGKATELMKNEVRDFAAGRCASRPTASAAQLF
jgi:hypothetical protein